MHLEKSDEIYQKTCIRVKRVLTIGKERSQPISAFKMRTGKFLSSSVDPKMRVTIASICPCPDNEKECHFNSTFPVS